MWNAISGLYRWKTDVDLTEIQPHRHAADVKVPTLVAHGSDDRVIEMATGCRLFRSLPEDTVKSWIEVPGADHDNVLITDFPIYAEIAHWMIQHVPKS